MYTEEHGILGEDYLSRGEEVKKSLQSKNLSVEEFETLLSKYLGYVFARIPSEFWEETKSKVRRAVWSQLSKYVENVDVARKNGLGMILISNSVGYKSWTMYVVCKMLIDAGCTCFTILFDEFLFLLKECRDNRALKEELSERIRDTDFLFILDVPDNVEVSSWVADIIAMLILRVNRCRPVLFTINSSYISLNDIPASSFLGRLLLPFVRVNKLIVVEDSGDLNSLADDKWGLLGA